MYMRRCGIPFKTIAKVTGHQNLESLTKHYDLQLEVGAPLSLNFTFYGDFEATGKFKRDQFIKTTLLFM